MDLTLGRGETLGLVGESGCGKSTLARVLLMLERPDAGTVRFGGVDPFALRGKELLAWRRRVQMVFQDPYASLNARMTAADLIGEPWRTHRDVVPRRRTRGAGPGAAGAGRAAGGDARPVPAASSPAGSGSGSGSRGRWRWTRTSSSCDEPVSALDLSVQAQVLNLLAELQRELGVSYVFISHDLSVVRHVADRVSVMYLGKVVETGADGGGVRAAGAPVHGGADVGGADAGARRRASGSGSCSAASSRRRWTRRRAAGSGPAAGGRRTGAPDRGPTRRDPGHGRGAEPHTALCHFPLEAATSAAGTS